MASSSSGFYVGGHRFSYKEASTLAAQPDTCLETVDSHVDLLIPMARINQLGDGIKEALNMQLNHCVESLDGVLIAYQRLRLHSPSLDLSEYMSEMQEVRVFGTFVVFRPKPGKRLKGMVTRVNQHHVGCLVHQSFATTLRSSSSSNISFDGLYCQGEEVTFEVVAMDIHRGIPSVRGCLTDELILSHRGTTSSLVPPPPPSTFLTDDLLESEISSHKKKKKKKRSGEDETSSTPTDSGISTTTDVTEDTFSTVDFITPEPSRKSKKRKRELTLTPEYVVDLPEISGMDISLVTETSEGSVKKKKKKKRRHEEEEETPTAQPEDVEMQEAAQDTETEPEMPGSRKKNRKKRPSELLET
ncbi:hypothetical protein RvY_16537 [Ramazzottius varieornatus]|uniref:RPA43 OB domain-containing protein n=1 Tax=Ramazzottius varieornatus TaxID=947166 RepID=A0A1D1VZM2_RAMVA|nr:hypothetical protein RvY_16537 [Ramazzottius varieornatus]